MRFPPEVEPDECEAEGEGEEQEPQALPLEEQREERGQVGSGLALQAASTKCSLLFPLSSQTCQEGITTLFTLVGTLGSEKGSDLSNITEPEVAK